MALAHLLHTAGIPMELAHVNFGLRDSESDGDEEFVKNGAKRMGFLCMCIEQKPKIGPRKMEFQSKWPHEKFAISFLKKFEASITWQAS